MATIVFESDKKVREVLASLLMAAGQKKIMVTGHPAQFQHWLREEDSNTRLIVVGAHPGEDVQLLLIKMVEDIRGLDGVPLLYLSDTKTPFRQGQSRMTKVSRIDEFLARPFGLNSLKKSIARAHESRAASRDVILYYAARPSDSMLQALFEYENDFHWQEIVCVRTPAELSTRIEQLGWRVGAVYLSPSTATPELEERLSLLRNTRFGAQTPFVMLSQNSNDVVRVRNVCDIFLPSVLDMGAFATEAWRRILRTTSARLLQNWSCREIQSAVRLNLRANEFASASLLLAEGLRLDPNRFELLELAGAIEEKKGHVFQATVLYKRALSINPCSPYSHLRLLNLLKEGEEKELISRHSAEFCPRHPQVQNHLLNIRHALTPLASGTELAQ